MSDCLEATFLAAGRSKATDGGASMKGSFFPSSLRPVDFPGRDHHWLGALAEAIDRPLRRRHGVSEYTGLPTCILRMQISRNEREIVLADGTRLRPGERIITLHFWNDRVPLVPANGPTLGWARSLYQRFEISLQELARYLAIRPDLDDVTGICIKNSLGSAARTLQIARILSRAGFETTRELPPCSLTQRIHWLSENLFISLLVLSRNPAALRFDSFLRDRFVAYQSRRALEQRYGSPPTGVSRRKAP